MSELSNVNNPNTIEYLHYGNGAELSEAAWDFNTIYGCECDSSWEVGYGVAQWQQAEWFGPDCSLRRCPSGDNPYTYEYDEDCYKKNQHYDVSYAASNYTILELFALDLAHVRLGEIGNSCHVDCSNRGNCDYSTGKCTCYDGSWGDNCAQMSQAGGANFRLSNTERLTEYGKLATSLEFGNYTYDDLS
jgi:hypothetical protein